MDFPDGGEGGAKPWICDKNLLFDKIFAGNSDR